MTGHDYAALSIKALIWAGGAASTVVGAWFTSWLSSKTRIYYDARNNHLDDLKLKVLEPLRQGLETQYADLSFSINWMGQQYNPQASAGELPTIYGPMLVFSDPGPSLQSALDEALLEDARTKHYPDLILSWEKFRVAWLEQHIKEHLRFMQNIAQKILAASGLPAHPVPFGDPYVMHLFLADFVYHRLIRMSVTNLAVQPQTGSNEFVLSSGSTNAAAGSKVQMDALLDIVDKAIQDNRVRAGELQDELKKRLKERTSLLRQFSLAIAAKKLNGRCLLVRFF